MIEEGLHVIRAPLLRRVAGEGQGSEFVTVMVGAGMPPRADYEVEEATALILILERAIDGGGAVAVLLIPLSDLEHGGDGERVGGHPLVDGLPGPEFGVCRVLEQLLD